MPAKTRTRVSCDQCSKTFRGLFELIRHSVQHSPDKSVLKYKCDWPGCNHSTLQRSNLRAHIEAVHLKLRRHKCTIDPVNCNRSYTDASSLIRHKRKVHGHFRKGAGSRSPSESKSSDDSGSERLATPSLSPIFPESQFPQYPDCPMIPFDSASVPFEPMDLIMAGASFPQSLDYLQDTSFYGYSMPDFMQGPSCLPTIPQMSMEQQPFYPDTSVFQSSNPHQTTYDQTTYEETFSSTPFDVCPELMKTEARDDWASQCRKSMPPPFSSFVAAGNNNVPSTAVSGITSEFDQFMDKLQN